MRTVAIVVSHPIQHFCPFYRAVSRDGRVRLKVLFGSLAGARPYFDEGFNREIRWQVDLLEGFDHELLPGGESVADVNRPVSNGALAARLSALDPDVVLVYGFFHGISRAALRWARRRGKRVLLVSDSELRSRRSLWVRVRKRLSIPWLLGGVHGILTIGDCNEAYYLHYGAGRDRLYRCPLPIDEDSLGSALSRREECRRDLRARLDLPADAVVALQVGKLTRRKAAHHSIRALAAARVADVRVDRLFLVLVGDGPEARDLAALAKRLCPGAVKMPGFAEVEKLPSFYVGADVLVHPSAQDPHPLATSEAVYAGLPCIVSDRVGSVGPTDDVRVGENGLEYPFGNLERLSEHLRLLGTDPDLRARMGRRSLAIGKQRDLRRSVEGFVTAVERVSGDVRAGRT